jgi:nucleotide-binding universal stress UspA family protein
MYQRILVPVDGSPPSDRGLDEAIELAGNQSAELLLIHVVEDWKVAAGDVAALNLQGGMERLRKVGRAIVKDAERRAQKAGIPAKSELLEEFGLPVGACIVRRARKWPADLIVCGTHGRRGASRLLLGSDAEYVLRHTPVPLLLLRLQDGAGD